MPDRDLAAVTPSRTSGQRDPMRQPQFIRSTTFRWALAVAVVLAVFVIVLFGFIYWKADSYLIERSDRMIAGNCTILRGCPADVSWMRSLSISIRIPAAFNMPDYLIQTAARSQATWKGFRTT
jgi:hypothetical protein